MTLLKLHPRYIGQIVEMHYNTYFRQFALRDQNKNILGYTVKLEMQDVEFIVDAEKQSTAKRDNRVTYHAFMRGTLISYGVELVIPDTVELVSYSYMHNPWFYRKSQGHSSKCQYGKSVYCVKHGVKQGRVWVNEIS